MRDEINKILGKLLRKEISECNAVDMLFDLFNIDNYESLEREVKSRRQQITDINQWTEILIHYKHKIRERVLWSMINDINNRTTD